MVVRGICLDVLKDIWGFTIESGAKKTGDVTERNRRWRRTMKRIMLIVMPMVIGLGIYRDARAQSLGVTGGLNIASLNGVDGTWPKDGLIVGGFAEFGLVGGMALQPEVLFSMKGVNGKPVGTQPVGAGPYEWTLNYVEVPILLKFDVLTIPVLPVDVDLFAGPDFAFNVTSENKSSFGGVTFTTNESGNMRPFDFNITVGGGPNIDLGPVALGVELRYTFGTNSPFKNEFAAALPDDGGKNGVWSIMASAAF